MMETYIIIRSVEILWILYMLALGKCGRGLFVESWYFLCNNHGHTVSHYLCQAIW